MISCCMMVQDEEECIARCLDSVHEYVDEIVIIDGGSMDNTKQIITRYPKATVYDIPFEKDFGKQRNNAIERAKGDWIFIIDADEYLYPYVAKKLQYLTTLEYDCYSFTRKTLIDGDLANPLDLDITYRLFRSYCRYNGNIHEPVTEFKNKKDSNMEIIHDKKSEWQQKDNELYWDMGQTPPDGWVKINGKWVWMEDAVENFIDSSLSALLCIYNEELMLRACLSNLVKFVDEIIIVDGSPKGASNDGSKAIIDEFMQNHLMIKYFSGTFAYEDGAWDEPSQINFGLEQVTKGYVMRTHPDIIYDPNDMEFLRQAMADGKKYIYCTQVDFWGDTSHILLYRNSSIEDALLHQAVIDPLAVSMNCGFHAVSNGELRQFGMVADIDYSTDIQYLPHIKKYHFGFLKPFKEQVEKYVCYAKRGDMGLEKQTYSQKELYEFAIEFVLNNYKTEKMKYYGYYPDDAMPFKNTSYMDGYDEFMAWFNSKFNTERFSKPTKEGYENITLDTLKGIAESMAWQWGPHEAIGEDGLHGGAENRIVSTIKSLGSNFAILDIGCANAPFLSYYKKSGLARKAVGIDISENGIENAKATAMQNQVEIELYAIPIDNFEYPEKFDVIRMTEVIEHVMDIPAALTKINSMLTDNGIFIGTAPVGRMGDGDAHVHYFWDDDLRNLMDRYLTIVEFDTMNFRPDFPDGEHHFFFHCRRKA